MELGSPPDPADDLAWSQGFLGRVLDDLSLVLDRPIALRAASCARSRTRPAGEGAVHVSFRQAYTTPGAVRRGCLLLPLPEALTLAGHLMGLADWAVARSRELEQPDRSLKIALLELSSLLASAAERALRERVGEEVTVRSEGCQGVRAGVPPALAREEGRELLVLRAAARIDAFEPFALLWILPPVPRAASVSAPS